ncbi:CehA/McbA family metallohydrolase [Rubrivirga litoralis]|uniref:CehA/McbA family metallohydrolase n=1 Tax=Rubrivirga litoralis TaxID=3075598 RepID=A0ABU3BLF8_9BACT|nr:CehA/McbA family metallohydrolase [Rubrivirga sp. F394]MDT0630117.1 CehA/McbA family metallohydrolase [Rubrivirga sp. F394]
MLTAPPARALLLRVLLLAVVAALAAPPALAQWTNRYPQVPGYGHHVYLEGYDLPTMGAGVTDPAPSPDGRTLALASRGWLWLLDLETGVARRLTSGGAVDARPAWSPDGRRLAFVRDTGRETSIVVLDVEGGAERVVAAEAGLELDPAWTPDGAALVYAAAGENGVGLRRIDLATGERAVVTDAPGLAVAPAVLPDGRGVVYVAKRGAEEVRVRDLATGDERVLYAGRILSQTRPALAPDGQTVALSVPTDDGWELVLADVDRPGPTLRLVAGDAPPLAPAWSPDGAAIYYAQADADERLRLMRVPAEGGAAEEVPVRTWDWGTETGTLTLRTTVGGAPAPARFAVTDAAGHPLVADRQAWFDGQNGVVYQYSPGEVTLEVPAGEVRVVAVQGLATPPATATATVAPGGAETVALALEPVWDAAADGWLSGDHHFHLNYGGPYALTPDDLAPLLAGEALDVATPLVANLHTRYEDDQFWGAGSTRALPYVAFGQEVRSHFFGHVALVGTETLFDPWIWGPGYEVFGDDDRENATAIAHARSEGGMGTYVHPVAVRDPFEPGAEGAVPVELVADGVLGDLDAIEVVCLWTDDLGTAEVWYRLLNLGQTVVPTAGSDVMSNFYRTMAPGTTRAYVRAGADASFDAYLDGLMSGQSVVTTGPLLDVEVDGAAPGGVVSGGEVRWAADLASAVPVDRVEVVVNGRVVQTVPGLAAPGRREIRGTVTLPQAGWVAVRAVSDEPQGWPSMAAYPFAHTAPVWIGGGGNLDPAAMREAAHDLLRVLDVSEARFETAYAGEDAPRLRERFRRARAELERRAGR